MMKWRISWICQRSYQIALIVVFVFTIVFQTSRADTQGGNSSREINQAEFDFLLVEEALKDFNGPDHRRATASILTISGLPYLEMSDLLVDLTLNELRGRRNRMILEALLNELVLRVDRRQLFDSDGRAISDSRLLELKFELHSAVYKETRYEKVRNKFISLMEQVLTRAKTQILDYPRLADLVVSPVQGEPYDSRVRKNLPGEQVVPDVLGSTPAYPRFFDQLRGLSKKGRWSSPKEVKAGDSGPVDLVTAGIVRYVTDEIADELERGKMFQIVGRNDILEDVMLVLSRHKQQNVVLLGSRGSGKTSIVDLLAEAIVKDEVSHNDVTQFLKDAVIIQTSSGRISRLAKSDKPAGQADAMEAFFQAVSEIQGMIGRRVIVFMDEIHTLTKEQVEAIKPFIESSTSQIMLIGASTSPEYRGAFKHNEAFLSRMQEVPVRELSEAEILNIFKKSWMPILTARHKGLTIHEEIMKLIIRKSLMVYPDKGILRATFDFADDLASYLRYHSKRKAAIAFSSQDVFNFIQRKIGLPVDPRNFVLMEKYRKDLAEKISGRVFGQDRLIDDVVDLWMSVLRNESSRGIRVGMVLGRSGTGKSETATQLAINALGSAERVLTIKGNDYADADDIKLGVLFGVPGGVRFGEHSAGVLMDWLDDPSKGKYAGIIVIDEIEKVSPLFWLRWMEFFETGSILGGDNKMRTLNRHLVLLTTNRGDQEIFPPDSVNWSEKHMESRVNSMSEEDIKSLFERALHLQDRGQVPDSILNRIDMYTVSKLITMRVARTIVSKLVEDMVRDYLEKSGVIVEVSSETVDEFIRIYDPIKRGARPLARALGRYLPSVIERAAGTIEYQIADHMRVRIGKDSKGQPVLVAEMNQKNAYVNLPLGAGMGEPTANQCIRVFSRNI